MGSDLRNRIIFTIFILSVYRLGTYIPLPGIDAQALQSLMESNQRGLLGMFNIFSGGAVSRMAIFALGIMPYISSSIIIQLLTGVSETFKNLKNQGEIGRKKITQYTRYGTVLLATVQGYGVSVGLENSGTVVADPGFYFKLTTVISLVAGTIFLMWLGEQITSRGVGNGISLIITAGIVANLPAALVSTLQLGRTGELSAAFILSILILMLGLIIFIVFIEKGQRRLMVQYPKRQVGNKVYGGQSSHLPLKINTAGVIPVIFASAILLLPNTMSGFGAGSSSEIFLIITSYLGRGQPLYLALFASMIMFFAFFYTGIVFNPDEQAENLRKYGGFIPGIRPGENTSIYIDYVLTRLTTVGAIYIAFVALLPEFLLSKTSIPFYLGGASLLIVVVVMIDFITQIQSHLFQHQYEGLLKKTKLKGRIKISGA